MATPGFDSRLRSLAEVIVRVGLNLQPGQPLLVTDPYDLQGVHPDAIVLAEAVQQAAGGETAIIPADPARLRTLAETGDHGGYEALVSEHTRRMRQHLARGGAFLFLTGSSPQLFAGVPPDCTAGFERIKWRHLGAIIQALVRGASQWTLAPAPSGAWATAAGVDVSKLWETVFAALRVDTANPTAEWKLHLAAIAWQRDEMNKARHRRLRYTGPGTDLVLLLPRSHRWCTTQLSTARGVSFVANLPTEELFTAPHKYSARGAVRVARPVVHAGTVITGIELEFRRGRVTGLRADTGQEALEHLLETDHGSARLGEVALVPGKDRLAWAGHAHHHILLDENATHHIALGDAYRFCSRAWFPLALNSSLVHVDLPLEAGAELS